MLVYLWGVFREIGGRLDVSFVGMLTVGSWGIFVRVEHGGLCCVRAWQRGLLGLGASHIVDKEI